MQKKKYTRFHSDLSLKKFENANKKAHDLNLNLKIAYIVTSLNTGQTAYVYNVGE